MDASGVDDHEIGVRGLWVKTFLSVDVPNLNR